MIVFIGIDIISFPYFHKLIFINLSFIEFKKSKYDQNDKCD